MKTIVALIILLAAATGFAQETNIVATIVPSTTIPAQVIPPAFAGVFSLLGKWAGLYSAVTSILFTVGIGLKTFMDKVQHGMNDRLALKIEERGTDKDLFNRRWLGSMWYRFPAYLCDMILRVKLPTLEGYLVQLEAQSTPGVEPVAKAENTAPFLATIPTAKPAPPVPQPAPAVPVAPSAATPFKF